MFDVKTFDVKKFDSILSRGLSYGLGDSSGQMCIEAAICSVLGMDHGDDPQCVAKSVRSFKISLNDRSWSSSKARAEGLRDLGLAQLGSLGIIDDVTFAKRLSEEIIGQLIPQLFREIFPNDEKLLAVALRCEIEKSYDASFAASCAAKGAASYAASWAANSAASCASYASYASYAASAARYVGDAARAACAANSAARGAARAADFAARYVGDKYLILAAQIALQILKELNSPGCILLSPDVKNPNINT